MRTLIVYDSNFGNTEKIAKEIASGIGKTAKAVAVGEVKENDIQGIELLLIGSPINGWRPTAKITNFVKDLGKYGLKGVRGAAFDTRIKVWFSGDAAGKISARMKEAGIRIVAPPKQFLVEDKEGPLLDGEPEKALAWGKQLKKIKG